MQSKTQHNKLERPVEVQLTSSNKPMTFKPPNYSVNHQRNKTKDCDFKNGELAYKSKSIAELMS